jgi:hypothetical protein
MVGKQGSQILDVSVVGAKGVGHLRDFGALSDGSINPLTIAVGVGGADGDGAGLANA